MKRFFSIFISLLGFFVIAGCSSSLDEKGLASSGETGTIIINMGSQTENRALDTNLIKKVSYKVQSSDMTEITGITTVENGAGTITINAVPIGNNRIITIVAQDSNSKNIKGFEISEVCNIKSGNNEIEQITWKTTAKANVYKKLLVAGKDIAKFTNEQNAWISSAVPADKEEYLVNIDGIVKDFDTLKAGGSYKLAAGKVTFSAKGAKGWKVCINDPTSESTTINEDGNFEISNVAP